MTDRLQELLKCFELRAGVFHSGPLCHSACFDESDGLGYIHVLEAGQILVSSPGHPTLLVDEPSLLFYMGPMSHTLQPQAGQASESIQLVCATIEFGASLRNPLVQALNQVVLISLSDMPDLAAILQVLFSEARQVQCGRQVVLNRLMEVVIINVLRDLMNQQRLQVGLLAGLADQRLAKSINAMHAAPEQAWTLAELAATAGMSRARFAVKFRDIVGMTPGHYLSEWRLAVAQSLLRQGKPVQLISDTVGYGSASAMSRAFRAQLGMSPTEWVKQYNASPAVDIQ